VRAFLFFLLMLSTAAGGGRALASPSEKDIPPAPTRFFNDYAHLVAQGDADRLNERLSRFATESSNQVVVAIFPELPEGTYLEDFTVRTAHAWRVGQKKLDNGVVLFVFVKDHKSRLEVGYGLEGQLPDVVAKRILQDVMAPPFKQGQYAAGLDATIAAIVKAAQGSYPPPPPATTVTHQGSWAWLLVPFFGFFVLPYVGLRLSGADRSQYVSLFGVLFTFFFGIPLLIYLGYRITLFIQEARLHSSLLSSLLLSLGHLVDRVTGFLGSHLNEPYIPAFLLGAFFIFQIVRAARKSDRGGGSSNDWSGGSSSSGSGWSSGGSDSSSGGSYSGGGGDFGGGGASGSW
jgi:uncharacterized protein